MKQSQEKNRKIPVPTVDIIVRKDPDLILLERRAREPFQGKQVLPGGHVDYGETCEDAVLRELKEECSVEARVDGILGVYSDPKRDPRGQRISTVFIGSWISGEAKGADDAASAEWTKLDDARKLVETKELGFDHAKILGDYFKLLLEEGGRRNDTFWSTKM